MTDLETSIDYQQVVEALGDGVVIADPNGIIRLWNAAAERIFGFAHSEALGRSLDLIIPERLRPRHWAGYDKVMAAGETHYGHEVLRVPAVNNSGQPLSIAFTVALLFDPERKVTAIAAVIRDDTAQFAEERSLRKRVAELEKQKSVLEVATPKF